ncbi:MAG: pyridoxal phosphate-dependent aminotransferase [Spirochaetota bacterium]
MDIRALMTPTFAELEGGLFSSVSKADVGEGAGKLIERGTDILAWADPFFPDPSLPESVARAMTKAVEDGFPAHYSMPIGRAELRRTIAEKVTRQTGLQIDPSRNVIVTPGSDTGLLYAMMPFIAPGTEVLVPEPTYPNAFLNPRLLGGITVTVPLRAENAWQLDVAELERRLTPATKMVVICQPNNPTTKVHRRESLEALARFVVANDLILVCDQAFEDHVFDGRELVAPATLPGMWERTLTVCSVSKGLGLSGFRIGYIYAHDAIMDVLYGGAVNVLGTAATVTSIGANEALADDALLADIHARLDRRRTIACDELGSIPGVRMEPPETGILAWLDVSALGTSQEIVAYLLEQANVLVNPGDQYGEHGEGFIRLVYAAFADDDRAAAVFARIRDALTDLAREKGVS